jgi:two-component system cell cycle sensor histidine kinase/response regulator CckA
MSEQISAGTILVIDDEQFVADLTRDILSRFGYAALVAVDGREAIELYRDRHADIKAIVLDLVMPGMDGREIFGSIRSINSEAKVIIASGYSREGDADDLLALGAAGFVQKPYRLAEFMSVVSEVLGKK